MKNLRALVAEHNEAVAEADSMALNFHKYEVKVTDKLESALDFIGNNEYELVVADINLGQRGATTITSGKAIADALKPKLDKGQTRLILISGNVENQALFDEQLKGRTNVEYLPKPYSLVSYLKIS